MNGENFLKMLSDMRVNGRRLDFGLSIVIVIASALVASIHLYQETKRHLEMNQLQNQAFD